MLTVLLDLLKKHFRKAAVKTGLAFVALIFAVMGVAGLFLALFVALEPPLGALRSALILSGVAFALALVASAPLWWPKRRPPRTPAPILAQLLALTNSGASGLSARQILLGAAIIALALGVSAGKGPPEAK